MSLIMSTPGAKRRVQNEVIVSAGGDPYWADVVALLHFQGPNGSTTFTDSKGILTWAPTNATITTSNPKFGTSAGNFRVNGARLTPSAVIPSGLPAEFTVEGWIYPTVAAISAIIRWEPPGYGLYMRADRTLQWYNNGVYGAASAAMTLNTWNFVAATRDASNVIRTFLGGVVSGSTMSSSANLNQAFRVGGDTFNQELGGEFGEFRLTKGVCRYTTNFTPPAAPFPDF